MSTRQERAGGRPHWTLFAALLGVAAVAGSAWLLVGQRVIDLVRTASLPSPSETIDQYCLDCHNSQDRVAGLALDVLDPVRVGENTEVWEKVIRKVRAGQMPKHDPNMPRLDPAAERRMTAALEKLVSSLEARIDRLAAQRPAPGRPLLGRLNRAEYANAIRDLLGLEVDVSLLLPPDDSAYGFDNVADVLGNSPALLQSYLTAARRISAMAVGDPRMPPDGVTYTARQDLSQDHHLAGLPLGTVGGMSVKHVFPVDGEYDFQVRLYRTNLSAIRGLEDPHQIELTIDGERVLLAQIGGDADLIALQANPTEASDALEAERLRIRVPVKAGQREVAAAFLGESPAIFDTSRLQPFIRDFNPYDAEGAPHVQSITIEGPFNVAPDSAAAPSDRLFVCRPSSPAEEVPCARRILTTFATKAYRRPVTESELQGLLAFFEQGRQEAGFVAGIQMAVRRVLASPSFVFIPEAEPDDLAPGSLYAISDFELATRLALFLWSSIPDDELLRVAGEGTLREPNVLAQQVRRMLAAPQASEFTKNFAGQWLHLRRLASIVPNSDLFPDFDHNLREALQREAELFFASVLHEDRSVLDLLKADYTFVNERLARHYGIDKVFGSEFRRVRLDDEARFGLLGKGAVLLATSHATTTSPVLRGKWVLENLLGTPPPPPPPNVDTSLSSDVGSEGAPQTMREQMERHWENPSCSGCHMLMDPIGFALEKFDATGAWRETNDIGARLDTTAIMFDGTEIDGVVDLRRALLARPEIFVQTLTEKLMVYALRRGLTYEDMPAVRSIVRNVRDDDYRFSTLLLEIVKSVPFKMRVKSQSPAFEAQTEENG